MINKKILQRNMSNMILVFIGKICSVFRGRINTNTEMLKVINYLNNGKKDHFFSFLLLVFSKFSTISTYWEKNRYYFNVM